MGAVSWRDVGSFQHLVHIAIFTSPNLKSIEIMWSSIGWPKWFRKNGLLCTYCNGATQTGKVVGTKLSNSWRVTLVVNWDAISVIEADVHRSTDALPRSHFDGRGVFSSVLTAVRIARRIRTILIGCWSQWSRYLVMLRYRLVSID